MSLQALFHELTYKSNWRFALQEGTTWSTGTLWSEPLGPTTVGNVVVSVGGGWPTSFVVEIMTPDSEDPERMIFVQHRFMIPEESFVANRDDAFWRRWLFDRIMDVERHEAMEFFRFDGFAPFFPEHGQYETLYIIKDKTQPTCYRSAMGMMVHGPGCVHSCIS